MVSRNLPESTERLDLYAEPVVLSQHLAPPPVSFVPLVALALAGCGGGETANSSSAGTPPSPSPPAPPPPPPPPPTTSQSARFLAQATMGTTDADIKSVVGQGYDEWLTNQFSKPRHSTFWDWLMANGYNSQSNIFSREIDAMVWSGLIGGSDQLRHRVGVALMSIFVLSTDSMPAYWVQFAMANYMDILWDNAFGNYRVLIEKISKNQAMSHYLTFLQSKKSNALGSIPDENFARELMQLFSIGLHELNPDGTVKLVNSKPVETYKLSDVSGLARVFTGWNEGGFDRTTPDVVKLQNVIELSEHEMGAKSFLGKTIPAGTDGPTSLKLALDIIFAHPNVGPFLSKQLIQHLVTSNPSPTYVARVAAKFEDNGKGVRGDLREVVRALLLDPEARNDAAAAASTSFGKLREPVLRLTGWARAFEATSPSQKWAIGDTRSPGYGLGQAVGRSPSVFNWFRPGYVPPGSATAAAGKVAPEFQLTNEVSVMGYINFMITTMRDGWGDFKGNFGDYLAIATDSQGLLDLINLRVAANQVSAATIAQCKPAIDSFPTANAADLKNRVMAATVLIMSSPEYLILK